MKRVTLTFHKPMESAMKKKLYDALTPVHMEIINESHMHNVPKGSETHFKIIVISDKFKDQPLIQCHRIIHKLLECELQSSVHALSIVAKTPSEWKGKDEKVSQSPSCKGGFGK